MNFCNELKASSADDIVKEYNYCNLMGALMYLENNKRSDISKVVDILSQHTANATLYLYKCVQRVMGFLKSTRELGFVHEII